MTYFPERHTFHTHCNRVNELNFQAGPVHVFCTWNLFKHCLTFFRAGQWKENTAWEWRSYKLNWWFPELCASTENKRNHFWSRAVIWWLAIFPEPIKWFSISRSSFTSKMVSPAHEHYTYHFCDGRLYRFSCLPGVHHTILGTSNPKLLRCLNKNLLASNLQYQYLRTKFLWKFRHIVMPWRAWGATVRRTVDLSSSQNNFLCSEHQ